MSVFNIITKLRNTPGTNDKIKILKENKDNSTLKKVLYMALSPQVIYGIVKLPQPSTGWSQKTLDEALEDLNQLVERKVTGNAARDFVANLLGSLTPDDQEVLKLVLIKELNCGVNASNTNKAIGADFIQDTPYMRCEVASRKTLGRIQVPAYIEDKMDGQYLNTFCISDSVSFGSRNGKEYDFLGVFDTEVQAIKQHLVDKYGIVDPVLNGEVVAIDDEGNILPRTTSNGITQKFGKGTGTIFEAESLALIIWDVIPHEFFKKRHWGVKRKLRREMISSAIENSSCSKIRMVRGRYVNSIIEAYAYNSQCLKDGKEGSILKDDRGEWKDHTSPWQLKLKLKFEVELRAVKFEMGKINGKNKDTLGAVIFESEDGLLRVGVGTGFKEKLSTTYSHTLTRDFIWDNQVSLMNTIATIEANDIVLDKNATVYSLFLPVFVEWRPDRDTADTFDRIKESKESCIQVDKQK